MLRRASAAGEGEAGEEQLPSWLESMCEVMITSARACIRSALRTALKNAKTHRCFPWGKHQVMRVAFALYGGKRSEMDSVERDASSLSKTDAEVTDDRLPLAQGGALTQAGR